MSFRQLYSSTMFPVCNINISLCDSFCYIFEEWVTDTPVRPGQIREVLFEPPFFGPLIWSCIANRDLTSWWCAPLESKSTGESGSIVRASYEPRRVAGRAPHCEHVRPWSGHQQLVYAGRAAAATRRGCHHGTSRAARETSILAARLAMGVRTMYCMRRPCTRLARDMYILNTSINGRLAVLSSTIPCRQQ